ncbi:GrpB family protein [Jatrophihabitans sp.]|jgi:GrpB-like predicted nucleotidyltransferase (UPF0157 family)|uniref:GrpB family protein n=1 Tax=Jatrophihabitans sp. TaxID=1932789 RepID=UPI002EFD4857
MPTPDPDWPSWASEPVELVAPDPTWLARGRRAGQSLDEALGALLVCPVEHVGSTAIPGLPAKPILDLLAEVSDLAVAEQVAGLLAPQGWHYVPPELDGRPYERFFVQVLDGHRVAHLHLLRAGSPQRTDLVRFRDLLRGNRHLAADYAALKAGLAAAHRDDRERYSAAKHGFVTDVLRGQHSRGAG